MRIVESGVSGGRAGPGEVLGECGYPRLRRAPSRLAGSQQANAVEMGQNCGLGPDGWDHRVFEKGQVGSVRQEEDARQSSQLEERR